MKELKALSQNILDALEAAPRDASADTRVSTIESLVSEQIRSSTKAISSVSEYAEFLRAAGFAKSAVKKLAPAFKSIAAAATDSGQTETKAGLADLLGAVRAAGASLNQTLESK